MEIYVKATIVPVQRTNTSSLFFPMMPILTFAVLVTECSLSHVTESYWALAAAVGEGVTLLGMKLRWGDHLRQLLHVGRLDVHNVWEASTKETTAWPTQNWCSNLSQTFCREVLLVGSLIRPSNLSSFNVSKASVGKPINCGDKLKNFTVDYQIHKYCISLKLLGLKKMNVFKWNLNVLGDYETLDLWEEKTYQWFKAHLCGKQMIFFSHYFCSGTASSWFSRVINLIKPQRDLGCITARINSGEFWFKAA